MSEPLTDLLRRHLNGPRWQVTRDFVAELPNALDDVVRAMRDDLDLLVRQIDGHDASAEMSFVDLRITAEHTVLLLARLLPLTDSVLADLYMTEISDLEGDEPPRHSSSVKRYATELRPLIGRLDDLASRQTLGRSEQAQALLDLGSVLAALHTASVLLLKELLGMRIDQSPAITSNSDK